jgi:hypothetical protein
MLQRVARGRARHQALPRVRRHEPREVAARGGEVCRAQRRDDRLRPIGQRRTDRGLRTAADRRMAEDGHYDDGEAGGRRDGEEHAPARAGATRMDEDSRARRASPPVHSSEPRVEGADFGHDDRREIRRHDGRREPAEGARDRGIGLGEGVEFRLARGWGFAHAHETSPPSVRIVASRWRAVKRRDLTVFSGMPMASAISS